MTRLSILLLAVAVCLIATVHADNDNKNDEDDNILKEFTEFAKKNGRKFRSKKEQVTRLANFKKARSKVLAHNEAYEKGEETFKIAINQFSDKTLTEVVSQSTGLVVPDEIDNTTAPAQGNGSRTDRSRRSTTTLPDNFGEHSSILEFYF